MGTLETMTFIVQNRVSFIGEPEVNAFHHSVFHGRASRAGKAYPHFRDYHFSDEHADVGLDVLRSSSIWPSVSVPSLNWVVDESMLLTLDKLPCRRFLKCATVRTYPLSMNDIEAFTEGYTRPTAPEDLHDRVAKSLGVRDSCKPLWEVIVPRGNDLLAEARGDADRVLQWIIHEDDEPVELVIPSRTLTCNPFFIHEGSYVLSDRLFAVVREAIIPTFFHIDHIEDA